MTARSSFLLPPGYSAHAASHPVLSCRDAASWEAKLIANDAEAWIAMEAVGCALAQGALAEYRMTRYAPEDLKLFALVGKGHNGGDALLAMAELAELGRASAGVVFIAAALIDLKPNTRRALDRLEKALGGEGLEVFFGGDAIWQSWLDRLSDLLESERFDIAFDGLLGLSFAPPLRDYARKAIDLVNEAPNLRLRVAVDLPSGLGDRSGETHFEADVTFATGIFKSPLLHPAHRSCAGCIRYLDIGFFDENPSSEERVLIDSILDPLRERRSAMADKRAYGHLAIVAGSRGMPGALAMSVESALLSGVGLVTVFAPESVVSAMSVSWPEAMWAPFPETPQGGLALEGAHLLRERSREFSALLVGPGMGKEPETHALVQRLLLDWHGPVVLDADALHPAAIEALRARASRPAILTPHAGEFFRLAEENPSAYIDDETLRDVSEAAGAVIALKGPSTRISDGHHVFLNTTGNAILARGGSGDILSGLCGGLLALLPDHALEAACIAVHWHGKAADLAAIARGQHCSRSTLLADYLGPALSEG